MPGLCISSRRSLAVRMAGCGPVDPGSGQAAQKSRRRPHLINLVNVTRVKVFNSSFLFSPAPATEMPSYLGGFVAMVEVMSGVMYHATDHLPCSLVRARTPE